MIKSINLGELEKKVIILLERYKNPLVQVLRYWDEWRFVPSEIEGIVKYIIKNFHQTPENNIQISGIEYNININNNFFHVSDLSNGLKHEITISRKDYPITNHGSYRNINFKWKEYNEVSMSWNSYNHILSQAEKVKERSEIDQKSWLFSDIERHEIIIRNRFHDIPEKEKWDVIVSSKTHQHRRWEDEIALSIIEEQSRHYNEKEKMKELLYLHDSQSIFKLYEIMFYVYDMEEMLNNKHKYNNSIPLVGAMLWFHLPRIVKNYRLPNGKTIYWLDIPSCFQHFAYNLDTIENIFSEVDKVWVADKWLDIYEGWRSVWDKEIKPYINKKITDGAAIY